METKIIKGGWVGNKSVVEIELPVIMFRDEDTIYYALIPSLDILGYGKSPAEAKDSLHIILNEYFEYTTRNNTLLKDLKKHGWNISKRKKEIEPPSFFETLENNEEAKRIISTKDYEKRSESVRIPAFA
jgi:predicted RNase H-like HicB family nuclease